MAEDNHAAVADSLVVVADSLVAVEDNRVAVEVLYRVKGTPPLYPPMGR